ncbi:flexible cuticle protein 12-like [Prorops nasuta]|uniref:flexible cuticle protein 12-like n=1 Tax=Prorops nasuta TaxID=863751 RepID=UPI0034CF428C
MMKLIVALAAVLAVACAAPQVLQVPLAHTSPIRVQEQPVVLVKETPSDNIGVDGYNFGYELSNGETRQESAQLKNAGTEQEALVVTGSFSFVDQNTGVRYSVRYTADENGFHPEGDHIPA